MSTITINRPDDALARLREFAAAQGISPESLVSRCVQPLVADRETRG